MQTCPKCRGTGKILTLYEDLDDGQSLTLIKISDENDEDEDILYSLVVKDSFDDELAIPMNKDDLISLSNVIKKKFQELSPSTSVG